MITKFKLFEEMTDRSGFDLSKEWDDLTAEEKNEWSKRMKKERSGDHQFRSDKDWWNFFQHIDKKK